ncbi:MAG: S41 family peptidase [Pseudomonadota bacterium]
MPTLIIAIVLLFSGAVIADEVEEPSEENPKADELPLDEIRAFVEIYHKIKRDYVEKVDDDTLLKGAMRGMLAELDPHSAYLDEDDYEAIQEGTTGEFGGLGIEVGMSDGFVKVIAPIDDTPAQRAGILAGDTIIKLDETPVKGMSLVEAVKTMRGKPGTEIILTILREREEKPLEVKIIRDTVKVRSIRTRVLEPGYGYVRISQFQSRTGEELREAIAKLKADEGTTNGVVLDLRNNPGGVLGGAVSVADAFLGDGRIVYTDGRMDDSTLDFDASTPDLLEGAPVVVLVNEGSASASEIVAGALQDRQRAVIMGRKTFGKGSVQTIFPMNNSAALKLTTARYFTPAGRSIQAEGIVPDIVIDKVKLESIKSAANLSVTESNLAGHLANQDEKGGEADQQEADNKGGDKPLAERDYELYEALNLLKGMAILSAKPAG